MATVERWPGVSAEKIELALSTEEIYRKLESIKNVAELNIKLSCSSWCWSGEKFGGALFNLDQERGVGTAVTMTIVCGLVIFQFDLKDWAVLTMRKDMLLSKVGIYPSYTAGDPIKDELSTIGDGSRLTMVEIKEILTELKQLLT